MTILFWLLVGHALCDYPLQGDWLSKAKNRSFILTEYNGLQPRASVARYGNYEVIWPLALFCHALIHASAVMMITGSWVLACAEFIAHYLIDYLKCRGELSYNQDQVLHMMCKVAWAIIFVVTQ